MKIFLVLVLAIAHYVSIANTRTIPDTEVKDSNEVEGNGLKYLNSFVILV